ncbi:hypothetical protein HL658_35650 [Azospirillum sp. RWY-5-1]|uniref:Glycosyl transferase n=1 Tax=Azospirillum oleiclasticum TaxID=2735135 RepID=A0ABX2TN32_9PROT|nr:hypothetical protein [Azospirillum oleiclasticum]NYZ17907.1 hypothetical protein [Azospirillum oleiclasticum]NYZ25118.1 hypothetical protein [Azospirillum oleiclasticum]
MLLRMTHFVHSLHDQANLFQLPIELILVEWNPPADRPLFSELDIWPGSDDYFTFRIITVDADHHARFPYSSRIPLFQYLAKNIGIRRATGRFVLATNIDIILSDTLFEVLARRSLRAGYHYRLDRWDVDFSDVPPLVPHEERQRMCVENVKFIAHRFGALYPKPPSPGLSPADGLAQLANELQAVIDERWESLLLYSPYIFQYHPMHFNGCGDFALFATEDWFRLRGYLEEPIHSWHTDSIFLIQAQEAGIVELFTGLHRPAYHISHDAGWAAAPLARHPSTDFVFTREEGENGTGRVRIDPRYVARIGDADLAAYVDHVRGMGAFALNGEDWGAPHTAFQERVQ